ncbi:MAG: hypothetical protein MSG64_15975 [Pyrinomonadaceae bacterium MAG19_C2-C3]|nr:hypothetical protein [Pyrinomonadaceae bacterium MAG19_C2-C3]
MQYKWRALTLLITFSTFGVAGLTQTAKELENYRSMGKGRYAVRQGITMTVSFAKSGQAKNIIIQPADTSSGTTLTSRKGMSQGEVRDVVDEVAPKPSRGAFVNEISFLAGCSSIKTEVYERVKISRATVCNPGHDDLVREATIAWNDR